MKAISVTFHAQHHKILFNLRHEMTAIQIVDFEAPLDFAIVELKPPNMFVEILCRSETSFAHASLCLKYHALDRTSTIIQSLKIGSEKCAKVKQWYFVTIIVLTYCEKKLF